MKEAPVILRALPAESSVWANESCQPIPPPAPHTLHQCQFPSPTRASPEPAAEISPWSGAAIAGHQPGFDGRNLSFGDFILVPVLGSVRLGFDTVGREWACRGGEEVF
jgi:hypothetical protein